MDSVYTARRRRRKGTTPNARIDKLAGSGVLYTFSTDVIEADPLPAISIDFRMCSEVAGVARVTLSNRLSGRVPAPSVRTEFE